MASNPNDIIGRLDAMADDQARVLSSAELLAAMDRVASGGEQRGAIGNVVQPRPQANVGASALRRFRKIVEKSPGTQEALDSLMVVGSMLRHPPLLTALGCSKDKLEQLIQAVFSKMRGRLVPQNE